MIRFLIIIGIIFLAILLVMKIIRKKIENIMQQFVPKQQSHSKDTINEVLYEKDDVVVLKGEAERKSQTDK